MIHLDLQYYVPDDGEYVAEATDPNDPNGLVYVGEGSTIEDAIQAAVESYEAWRIMS